ncbi:MAG: carbohydrate kinase family protein [Candidatus Tectomicrobia bacterium]|nr:carbohydrate kinase family protein [Candidatus Tectomicrobia bacterium]
MDYHLLIIGTASLDRLHLPTHAQDEVAHAAGGAGLYTALAAHRAGSRTHLWAPRPDPMPPLLQPAAERLLWSGPSIAPAELPHLEIAHHGEGRATLLHASWGAELQLVPERLPSDMHQAAMIHVAALSTAQRQLEFVRAIQAARGANSHPRISVGTYARLVQGETAAVRQLVEHADLFFMNEHEAKGLWGQVAQARTRSDACLFITLGAQGALVMSGDAVTHVPGHATVEVDPTGAGDTFCGATLAGLARGESPITAAQYAVELAAQTVSAIGPAALLASEAE